MPTSGHNRIIVREANVIENPNELIPQVKERLDELTEGERLIYLKADSELPYSEVMRIMDLLREAGGEEIALIADPKVEG